MKNELMLRIKGVLSIYTINSWYYVSMNDNDLYTKHLMITVSLKQQVPRLAQCVIKQLTIRKNQTKKTTIHFIFRMNFKPKYAIMSGRYLQWSKLMNYDLIFHWIWNFLYWTNTFFTSHDLKADVFHIDWHVYRLNCQVSYGQRATAKFIQLVHSTLNS